MICARRLGITVCAKRRNVAIVSGVSVSILTTLTWLSLYEPSSFSSYLTL